MTERSNKITLLIDGDEYDILTAYRNRRKLKANNAKQVKRKFNKRNRRKVEEEIQRELDVWCDW